jgi:Tol biopolymer transport system component
MNAPVAKDSARPPIDLARIADFDLGAMRVRPAAREAAVGGETERLEPRVIQALVALWEAKGKVVSRDDLVARCWGGLSVSEDAINRAIQKLRRLSTLGGEPSFIIETIPRVGYRLKVDIGPGPDQPSVVPTPSLVDLARRRWRSLSIAAAAVAIVAGVWLAQRTPRYTLGVIEMATHSLRPEMEPTLSPDGRIAYVVEMGDGPRLGEATRRNTDLFMRRVGSDEEERLTETPDFPERAPAFSPRGSRLAYVRFATDALTTRCRIVVRDLDSRVDRDMGACAGTLRLSWTSDGVSLVYSDADAGTRRIRILNTKNGQARDLVAPFAGGWGDVDPTVSPDGKRLALVRHTSPDLVDVYVYNLRTRSSPARLVGGEHWAQMAWADDRSLFVTLKRARTTEVWRFGADGAGSGERLLTGVGHFSQPAVASGVLAIQMEAPVANLRRLGSSDAITSGNQWDHCADFSVRGDLAFISNRLGNSLYVQEAGGSPKRLVELIGTVARGLRWSPNGRRLVYTATHEGRGRVFIVNAESGVIEEVPLAPDLDPGNPSWSADGQSLLFTANDSAGPRLVRAPIGGGAPLQRISQRGWTEALETEEGLFARSLTASGVWRLAPGRAPELVLSEPRRWRDMGVGRFSPRDWTVAAGRVYALDTREPGRNRVISRSLAGGTVRRDGEIRDQFAGALAVNPRTGEIVYAAAVGGQSDIGIVRYRRE